MKRYGYFILFIAFITIFTNLTGCNLLNNDGGSPVFPGNDAATDASLNLNVVLPETQNQTDGSATIRGATTPSVKVILNIRQPGSETNKTQTIVKYFTVVSSAAEITFKNLPTGLIIAKLQIENGNIQGWKNLHGATDLVSGSNNLDVSPAGSKLKADLLASALQNAITNDKLMAAGGSNMATNLANALATVDTNTVNPYNTVLNLLIDQVNPTGIVKVQFDNTTDTLTAFDGATQLWQKSYTATEILGTEAIAGIDSSAFQAVRIVQQGFDDYFAIEWRDSSTIVSLITTHNPTTAQWQSLFINKGIFDQIVKISDSDYIIGGFDAIANRPGIWKWNINNNAFANSVTDGSTNLDWEISFSELAYSTMSTNGKVIENLMYDGQGNINAVVKTEDGESKTYLLSLSDGSKTDITPPDFSIDTILTLSYPGSVYAYSSSLEKIKLNLPVNNETAKYALVVVNTSGTSQTIKINPESYVTSRRAEQVNSLRANVLTPQPPNDLAWRYANQTRLQNNMRKKIGLRRSSLTNGAKASMQIRASDNSSEYEGQIKTLYTVSKSYGDGGPMIPRECKLVKIGQYCKIFVDQEEYQGLSAIDGDYKVTDADVEHFATEFDTRIYDLLTNSYAPVYDFDNDGKFTILISPVYAKLGFAGLFNTIHLTPAEYAGTGSNQRDMVGIWSPNEGTSGFQWTGETWREATRETIAHEMQHAANYSAKFWSTGTYNRSAQMEEVWLDEGLSVGVEARYRVMRGDPAGENRFDYWAENPSSTNLTQFSTIFNPFLSYGMNGLFNFYLFHQKGSQAIQSLVQSGEYGVANMDAVFADRGGLKGVFKDWSMAIMLEGLRNSVNNPGGVSLVDINQIDNRYRYNQYLDLGSPSKQFAYQNLLFGQQADSMTIPNYAAAFFVLNEPTYFAENYYQFIIESDLGKNIDILIVRLPTP